MQYYYDLTVDWELAKPADVLIHTVLGVAADVCGGEDGEDLHSVDERR
jgi:hypothetical protein